jgi:hypothetical protein
MKRFWLVLLSLGLVMAFSVSAFAVDVKVSAEYYAAGMYLNKVSVADIEGTSNGNGGYLSNPSTAFFFQRLRMGTDFVVSPCLKLVTRFDAMERIWGGQRSTVPLNTTTDMESAGTRAENENIAVDLIYIDYTSPIGLFRVGYQPDYEWGTVFANRTSGSPQGMITYAVPVGPVTILAQYVKETDGSASAVTTAKTTDQDYDSYRIGVIYPFKNANAVGEAGLLGVFNRDATEKAYYTTLYGDTGHLVNVYSLQPYFKATIGPVALQGEVNYFFGDAVKMEQSALTSKNESVSALSVFLDATANFGMFYAGGSFAYLSGDDPGTTDKVEGNIAVNGAGLDWNPCLMMFNNDLRYWGGSVYGNDSSVLNNEMNNAWFFQGRVGVKPTPQSDILLAVSYATADKKPGTFNPLTGVQTGTYANGTYGTEIDLVGTYKITNNLTYMLGAGYLFTGDYFKGVDSGNNKVNDDFTVINKLTLSF